MSNEPDRGTEDDGSSVIAGSRPLAGITVVSLEQAVAAPFATRQLADLGARVIKIERPGEGDFARSYDRTVRGMSSHFVWTNRSKESLTLDLKHPRGKTILDTLLADADVFVQNLAPGAVERLGFGASRLTEQYPRLIVCNLSGYGSSGPYQEKKAYDILIQAEAGLISITGTHDSPSRAGVAVADIAGAMYAFTGILTALYQRERIGRGLVLEVSLFDGLAEWMGYPLYYTAYGGVQPARAGATHPAVAPYGPYEAGDEKLVMLSVQNEREWASFCTVVLDRPDLIDDPRFTTTSGRVAHRPELDAVILEVFGALTAEDVIARLDKAGIANARANTVVEFLDHPQLAARDRWRPVTTPVGTIKALLPPVISGDIDYVMDAVPDVGADTERILREIGYGDEIARLRNEQVI